MRHHNLQVTGSVVVNGLGVATASELTAYTASTDAKISSLQSFTASVGTTNTFTASANSRLNAIEITTASNIARLNSIETITSSASARLNSIETVSASNIARLSSLETKSASVDTTNTTQNARLSALETTSASVDTLNTTQNSRLNSLEQKTGSLATTGSNTFIGTQIITGSLFVQNNLVVQGSSSLQNITASAVSIGTNTVLLNTATPSIRFAGISAIDSGSAAGTSGSLFFDSTDNEWIFVHQGNVAVTSSTVITGPETYDSVGNEIRLTTNSIPKAQSGFHLYDSCITDNGTTTCIKNNLITTGTINSANITSTGTITSVCSVISGTPANSSSLLLENFNGDQTATTLKLKSGRADVFYHMQAFSSNTSEVFRIESTGKIVGAAGATFAGQVCSLMSNFSCIGIGTQTPAYDITLSKSVAAGNVIINLENTSTTGAARFYFGNNASSTGARIQYFGATHAVRPNLFSIGTDAANDMMFETSGTERMRITSTGISCFSGNVTINKSTNSGTGTVFPRFTIQNTLATQGDGTTTFNFADINISSGNEAVNMFLGTTYAAGNWAPAGLINVATNNDLQIKTSNTIRLNLTSTGIASFCCQICSPNIISTDATHTTIRINSAIVPLANYRTSDCGYGGIDFFDNGKGYACGAKFYTFKTSAEYYGLTNDYNGSAQLALVSCGAGGGNNISLYTGTSNTAKLRIDNSLAIFACSVCTGPALVVGSQGGTDTTVIGGGSGVGSLIRMNYAGGSYNNFLAGNGDNYFNCLLGKLNAAGGVKFSGGSTTLNYYEEGSWTPALQNATVSYDFRSGTYVRMGNWVFVRWGFKISSISGQSGTIQISGLPFTSATFGSYQEPNISVSTGNLVSSDLAQRARLYKGNADTSLFGRIANNGDTTWNTSELQTNSWIIGEIFYNV